MALNPSTQKPFLVGRFDSDKFLDVVRTCRSDRAIDPRARLVAEALEKGPVLTGTPLGVETLHLYGRD